ncbi:uncharacterized protein LOC113147220 [Cyclospora cayetanensis]|uniref:Uncharacterized protein LOC113147220 n=1 Tax=Cyclospora cayetanensis TaxID=88456 RepID=A0A6P6RY54_9EIME|nr:uncharacterized protein LOC113147220 [Cyclospora cayetanensis]
MCGFRPAPASLRSSGAQPLLNFCFFAASRRFRASASPIFDFNPPFRVPHHHHRNEEEAGRSPTGQLLQRAQQPNVCVLLIGTDSCSLCTKAALSVQRIASALSLPLLCHTSAATAPAFPSPAALAAALKAFQTSVQEFPPQVHQANAKPLLLSCHDSPTAIKAPSDCAAHPSACESFADEAAESNSLPAIAPFPVFFAAPNRIDPSASKVSVELHKLSLDDTSTVAQLRLTPREEEALRAHVPVVFVGELAVSWLKFNAPAIRTAILNEGPPPLASARHGIYLLEFELSAFCT